MSDVNYKCDRCGRVMICRHCGHFAANCDLYPGELWDPVCPVTWHREDELYWVLLVEFDTPAEAEVFYEEVGRWQSCDATKQSDTVTVVTSSLTDSLVEPVSYLLRTCSPRQLSLTRSEP